MILDKGPQFVAKIQDFYANYLVSRQNSQQYGTLKPMVKVKLQTRRWNITFEAI